MIPGEQTFTAADQLDADTQYLATSTSTIYNEARQEAQTTDENDNVTQTFYDSRGLAVETRQEVQDANGTQWLDTLTYYNVAGQAAFTTDQFVEGSAPSTIDGTETLYDSLGRTVGTEQVNGLNIGVQTTDPDGNPLDAIVETTAPAPASAGVPGYTAVPSTQTVYDDAGNVQESIDQYGTQTWYVYDADGRQIESRTQAKAADGSLHWLVTRTVYDADGNATYTTDSYEDGDGMHGDGAGSGPGLSSPPVWGTATQYDADGRAIVTQRVSGLVIQLVDTNGSWTSVVKSPGTVVSSSETVYDADGNVVQQTAPHAPGAPAATTYSFYNSSGQLTAELTPAEYNSDGSVSAYDRKEFSYNAAGEQTEVSDDISQTDPNDPTTIDRTNEEDTKYAYDANGNVVQTTYADGSYVLDSYDSQGNKIAESDQLASSVSAVWSTGNDSYVQTVDGVVEDIPTTLYSYNTTGQLASVTLPSVPDYTTFADVDSGNAGTTNPTYTYGYDANGDQTSITDPMGRVTTFTFDDQGNQLTHTLPLGNVDTATPGSFTESSQYNSLGQLIESVSFEGVVTAYQYDDSPGADGRLTEKLYYSTDAAYAAGTPTDTATYSYDVFGHQTKVVQTSASGIRETDNTYDALGNLIQVTTPEGTVNYTYDPVTGEHTGTWTGTDPNAPEDATTYAYNPSGELTSVTVTAQNGQQFATPVVTSYAYDLVGNLSEESLPNGVVNKYYYDKLNRLLTLREVQERHGCRVGRVRLHPVGRRQPRASKRRSTTARRRRSTTSTGRMTISGGSRRKPTSAR